MLLFHINFFLLVRFLINLLPIHVNLDGKKERWNYYTRPEYIKIYVHDPDT